MGFLIHVHCTDNNLKGYYLLTYGSYNYKKITIIQAIKLNLLLKWLLGSNLSQNQYVNQYWIFCFSWITGVTYNIPVCVWLQENHPYVPPLVFVKPTSSMAIKASHHVDTNGRVYLPFLHEWSYVCISNYYHCSSIKCIYHHQNCCSTVVYILTVEYVMSYFSETLIYM